MNAPYIWAKTPNGMKSWDFFDKLLEETGVVTTPGSGFGPSGEGYVRFTAFSTKENTIKAMEKIKANFVKYLVDKIKIMCYNKFTQDNKIIFLTKQKAFSIGTYQFMDWYVLIETSFLFGGIQRKD